MQPWTVEHGSLWALETDAGLPPRCTARINAAFRELAPMDADALAIAMNQPAPDIVRERLRNGRRCFGLWVDGRIVTYGWVTRGVEQVGELERTFQIYDDEAYIWDCSTIAEQRGQRCYSALLSHMIYQLHGEGIARIWIGASRQNQPSIRGFANAGFSWILDLTYQRLYRLTLMQIRRAPTARHAQILAAYRLLRDSHERRLGSLLIGYRR